MRGRDWLDEWDEVVAGGTAATIEEAWLARLEGGVADPDPLIEALRRLRSAGKKTLAATLLELAADQALAEGSWRARKRFLAELLRLGIGDAAALRASLEKAVRETWAGRPSLEALMRHFRLHESKKPVETLEQLEAWLAHDIGDVFLMAGRGPGRVVEASPQLGVLRLDFEKERRVPVPIDAAAKYLSPLPPGHFLRRRLEEPETLRAEVAADPPGALEALLESYGRPLSAGEIRGALENLIAPDQWSAWWNRAKKSPRVLAEGSGTKVEYRLAAAGGAEDEIRTSFAAATLSQKTDLARRHGGRDRDLTAEMAAALLAGAGRSGEAAGTAWEAVTVAARLGAPTEAVAAARKGLLQRHGARALLDEIADPFQREEVMALARECVADWPALFATQLELETNARLLTRIASELWEKGEGARVEAFLDEVFLHPQRHPAALVWACEPSDNPALDAVLDQRRTGALLVRLADLAERKEFVPYRPRLKGLLSAGGMAGIVIQSRLTIEQARRLLQVLERPGEMGEERRWLARAVAARFPELRKAKGEDALPALAATVARLQDELRTLREKAIPETLRAIQVAREHGDLSENFEYHAARARQEYLSARAAELQGDLARVQVIDPAAVDTSEVRVGTAVLLAGVADGAPRSVTILGPYEANPEAGILSHGSEAAQQLLGRKAGDEVVFDGAPWRIVEIGPAVP